MKLALSLINFDFGLNLSANKLNDYRSNKNYLDEESTTKILNQSAKCSRTESTFIRTSLIAVTQWWLERPGTITLL